MRSGAERRFLIGMVSRPFWFCFAPCSDPTLTHCGFRRCEYHHIRYRGNFVQMPVQVYFEGWANVKLQYRFEIAVLRVVSLSVAGGQEKSISRTAAGPQISTPTLLRGRRCFNDTSKLAEPTLRPRTVVTGMESQPHRLHLRVVQADLLP